MPINLNNIPSLSQKKGCTDRTTPFGQFQNRILIHNRDSAYKQQPHLSWRDSSIDLLVHACLSIFNNDLLVRIGASGHTVPENSGVIDLANDKRFECVESTLLDDASLLISTTSGPGHFAHELYGLRSLLLNFTSLVTGDFVHQGKF
jgi:putative glycosyltransferase (TIGR04372 family)